MRADKYYGFDFQHIVQPCSSFVESVVSLLFPAVQILKTQETSVRLTGCFFASVWQEARSMLAGPLLGNLIA